MHRGYSVPGVVTGKPVPVGGSSGRADATGQGVVYTIEEAAARRIGLALAGAHCRGPGLRQRRRGDRSAASPRPGRASSRSRTSAAASTAKEAWTCPLLRRLHAGAGTLAGAPGTVPIDNEQLFGLDVDVLVLAALEGQITAANAGSVRARIVAEGANGPTTPGADPILHDNGVVVIPDILCNAGGVIVSYFEWVQNRESLFWTPKIINGRLREVNPDGRSCRLGAGGRRRDRAAPGRARDRGTARRRGDGAARHLSVARSRFLPQGPAAHTRLGPDSRNPRPPRRPFVRAPVSASENDDAGWSPKVPTRVRAAMSAREGASPSAWS